jgi:hypothetical protein
MSERENVAFELPRRIVKEPYPGRLTFLPRIKVGATFLSGSFAGHVWSRA